MGVPEVHCEPQNVISACLKGIRGELWGNSGGIMEISWEMVRFPEFSHDSPRIPPRFPGISYITLEEGFTVVLQDTAQARSDGHSQRSPKKEGSGPIRIV